MSAQGRGGLCALSVDLDEIGQYHAIHGLPPPDAVSARAVYRIAIERLARLADGVQAPITWFAIGADMAVDDNADRLRALAARGHEIGNHSLDHRYDLVRLASAELRRQVGVGREVLIGATAQPVVGFRAPGYSVSAELLATVTATGHVYDSSVFPSPAYMAAKLGVMGWMRARGRQSASIASDPRILRAPTTPYRPGEQPWQRGAGALVELPVQVTPTTRLPVIGTSLTTLPEPAAQALVRACLAEPLINLELHGLDALGAADGLDALHAHQPDAALPAAVKLERLGAALAMIREAGYRFVTLREAARAF